MNIGGLYQIKKWFWLLYPTKDIAEASSPVDCWGNVGDATAVAVATAARYWSKELNCNVSFISQNSMFMLLEQTDKVCKILTGNGECGWIIYPENKYWAKGCIEEVNQCHILKS